MPRRPATLWIALVASLITAALPPAVFARTVCEATGRVAVAWGGSECCALATSTEPPACCQDGHDRPGDPAPKPVDDQDDCCSTTPALSPTIQPDSDGAAIAAPTPLPGLPSVAEIASTGPPRAPPRASSVRATGPPEHALRRHLGARRAMVQTI